jgi:hypothetical protein
VTLSESSRNWTLESERVHPYVIEQVACADSSGDHRKLYALAKFNVDLNSGIHRPYTAKRSFSGFPHT